MSIRSSLAIIPVFIGVLVSCNQKCGEDPAILNGVMEIEVERLEDEFFGFTDISQVHDFLGRHPMLKTEFLGSAQYPNDTILAQVLFQRIGNNAINTLRSDVENTFGDFSDVKTDLEHAFAYMRNFYPDLKVPRVQTFVTGFGTSEMYVSDSLIIIGLDYYAGREATYRPNNYPDYILERFQKDYIVPAIVLLLSDGFVQTDFSDNTMLADMIYYGKKYYFTENVLPCTPDSLIIWYSGKELEDVEDNQKIIWANFLQNELLYETNHLTKEKFLGERPNTYEISAICPGRIGAWVGWEIVRKYMDESPDTDLQQLMANPDAQEIFNTANYKGR